MHLYYRHLVDAQHVVLMEVALLHTTLVDGDPALQRRCQAERNPLWLCCSMIAGFTIRPQSTAHTTRCTFSLPWATETSATCAVKLPILWDSDTPRPRRAANGVPQAAFSAA